MPRGIFGGFSNPISPENLTTLCPPDLPRGVPPDVGNVGRASLEAAFCLRGWLRSASPFCRRLVRRLVHRSGGFGERDGARPPSLPLQPARNVVRNVCSSLVKGAKHHHERILKGANDQHGPSGSNPPLSFVASERPSSNGQLRTGTDLGNPTV